MAGFDEIVFHQLLGWHHLDDRSTLEGGLRSDGVLHALELVVLVTAIVVVASLVRRAALVRRSTAALAAEDDVTRSAGPGTGPPRRRSEA
jgi:uncharacterized membrane protein